MVGVANISFREMSYLDLSLKTFASSNAPLGIKKHLRPRGFGFVLGGAGIAGWSLGVEISLQNQLCTSYWLSRTLNCGITVFEGHEEKCGSLLRNSCILCRFNERQRGRAMCIIAYSQVRSVCVQVR